MVKITDLTLSHFLPVPSQDLDFQPTLSWSLLSRHLFEVKGGEGGVSFVDIGRIVNHHY